MARFNSFKEDAQEALIIEVSGKGLMCVLSDYSESISKIRIKRCTVVRNAQVGS